MPLYWDICKKYGLALSKRRGFAEGKPFFEKCIQTIQFGQTSIIPDGEPVAAACFYLAEFSMTESSMNMKAIESYINVGLANCVAGSYWSKRLNGIKNQLLGENASAICVDDRKYGRIRHYNLGRNFGIIEIANETYLFLPSGFRQGPPIELLHTLNGRAISCVIKKSLEKGSLIAVDIVLEGCCT